MFNINLNLILIAEMIELILDGFILLSTVRLLWDHYHAGSNHLPFRGGKSFLLRSAGVKLWSEKADGLGLRQRIVKTQSQNRQKRSAILDLKLKLMVRQLVAGIQNHDLEPEFNIKRLAACIGFWLLVSNSRQSFLT